MPGFTFSTRTNTLMMENPLKCNFTILAAGWGFFIDVKTQRGAIQY